MIDRPHSGYLLPNGFNVVSTAFEKVVDQRHISHFSQEGECLARYALKFYMNGTRNAWELEQKISNVCLFVDRPPQPSPRDEEITAWLPELLAWARSLTTSPVEADALAEHTLGYAIEHFDEFRENTDLRDWLVGLMMERRFGRSSNRRPH
ncbi:hypothetical protein [Ensifer adhaerens]|uniref:hypothetical protein n=1 Tax=Ensifer adhaerens TaxID=106592 RepID=UPI000CF13A36|nr:hypothetical protein [Ensifer adhaerens]